MQRFVILFLTTLSTFACKQDIDNWRITYPPELETQIELFEEYAPPDLKAKKLTIVLTGNGIKDHHGSLCAGLSMPRKKKIYLDTTSEHWMKCKTALVLHELGHYVLEREHDDRWLPYEIFGQSIPWSVMTIEPVVKESYMVDNEIYRDYYMNELFNGPLF